VTTTLYVETDIYIAITLGLRFEAGRTVSTTETKRAARKAGTQRPLTVFRVTSADDHVHPGSVYM